MSHIPLNSARTPLQCVLERSDQYEERYLDHCRRLGRIRSRRQRLSIYSLHFRWWFLRVYLLKCFVSGHIGGTVYGFRLCRLRSPEWSSWRKRVYLPIPRYRVTRISVSTKWKTILNIVKVIPLRPLGKGCCGRRINGRRLRVMQLLILLCPRGQGYSFSHRIRRFAGLLWLMPLEVYVMLEGRRDGLHHHQNQEDPDLLVMSLLIVPEFLN